MKTLRIFFVSALLLVSAAVSAQDRPMHEIHSMMVYNFMKYIEWPDKSGDFVITVVGDKDVYNTFNSYYGTKKIGTQSIQVKYADGVAGVAGNENLVYLSSKKSNEFDDLKAKTTGKPTLLITDRFGLGKKGSGINFKLVDNKLKFELNQEAFTQSNLKVSGALASMAILI
ncbi:YfiR family protein [Cytophagales bacterium LB-30]|uniref:YfiR family protein n=1 Tax=Shiella aurantiaca TaxID=3058365 RepID=A0ABT8F6I0_9BACT|nr:YfiR family protein [Shiella aurantiaca]MDN4165836.1 YfiR family protein [Shiella aurantiaca]